MDRARLFAASAALLFAAWLPRLVPNSYSSDDFILLHGESVEQSVRMYVTQGRLGMAVLHLALTGLGASPVHSYTALNLAAVALLAASAVLLLRLWDLEAAWPLAPLVGVLAFAHPYAAETWSFRIAPIYAAAALALALWGVVLIRRERGRTARGIGLIMLSLSIYQVGLNPLLVAVCIGACIDLWRVGPDREGMAATAKVWLITLGAVVGACVAYLLVAKIALLPLGMRLEGRTELLPLGDAGWRVKQIWRLLPQILGLDVHLGAPLLAALQIALLGVVVAAAALRSRVEGAAKLLLTLAVLFAALVAVVGIHAILRTFAPSPRALTAAGVFWAGVLALASLLIDPQRRKALVVLAGLLALGYVGIDHRAAAEQARLNARELGLAGRIADRLERLPKHAAVKRLVAIGHARSYPDLGTAEGDLNVSALYIPWSQAALVAEATGRPLDPPTDAERSFSQRHCAVAPKWPAEGAIAIQGELAIVCF